MSADLVNVNAKAIMDELVASDNNGAAVAVIGNRLEDVDP